MVVRNSSCMYLCMMVARCVSILNIFKCSHLTVIFNYLLLRLMVRNGYYYYHYYYYGFNVLHWSARYSNRIGYPTEIPSSTARKMYYAFLRNESYWTMQLSSHQHHQYNIETALFYTFFEPGDVCSFSFQSLSALSLSFVNVLAIDGESFSNILVPFAKNAEYLHSILIFSLSIDRSLHCTHSIYYIRCRFR